MKLPAKLKNFHRKEPEETQTYREQAELYQKLMLEYLDTVSYYLRQVSARLERYRE